MGDPWDQFPDAPAPPQSEGGSAYRPDPREILNIQRLMANPETREQGIAAGQALQQRMVTPSPQQQPPAADPYAEFHDAEPQRASQWLGVQKGVMHPLDNMAVGLERGLEAIGVPAGNMSRAMGLPSAADAAQQHQLALQQQAAQGVRPGGIGEFTGNIVGSLPALMLPGGPIVQSAAMGAMNTNSDNLLGVARDAAIGGVLGKAGDMGLRALGSGAAKVAEPAKRLLEDAGVRLTPGQKLGGAIQALEDKATSLPFVGDAIKTDRARSLDDFNRAAYARILDPLGETVDRGLRVGHDAIAALGDKAADAYSALMPGLTATVDEPMLAAVKEARSIGEILPAERVAQISKIIDGQLMGRFRPGAVAGPGGQLQGQALKDVEENLGRIAASYGKQGGDEGKIGDVAKALQTALRDNLERNNPQSAAALRKANEAWANLVRVEGAAKSTATGKFTPQQLATAVRRADQSTRGRAVSRGEALMQDLARAGQQVMSSTIADSGTAARAALANPVAMLTGGAGLVGYNSAKLLAKIIMGAQGAELAAPAARVAGVLPGRMHEAH